MTTNDITPALSAGEWERLRAYTGSSYSMFTSDWQLTAYLAMSRHEADSAGLPSPESRTPHVLLALANAALPDGDPRKITREDVRRIYEAIADAKDQQYRHINFAANDTNREMWDMWETKARLLAEVTAKLAALLPPE